MKAMKFLTTREAGEACNDAPEWLVRRIVDRLDPPVDRFGHKRMIPAERLPEIMKAVQEQRDRQATNKRVPELETSNMTIGLPLHGPKRD